MCWSLQTCICTVCAGFAFVTKYVCICMNISMCVCQEVRQASGRMVEYSIQYRLNEGFVQFAPDVESVCFIFTFLACSPYIFWKGQGVIISVENAAVWYLLNNISSFFCCCPVFLSMLSFIWE